MNMQRTARWMVGSLLMVCVVAVTGCGAGSSVNKANFDKLKAGMTMAEVEAILGKPTSTGATSLPKVDMPKLDMPKVEGMPDLPAVPSMPTSAETKTWVDGSKAINVTFLDGKVQSVAQVGL